MTETKDRHLVSEYWRSRLGHDIEIEDHFAQVNAWKAAPFKTYIVEQKVGDFILIPPLAPHQVWNRGTRTMKVAWNRTTVETLELAISDALPKARMVCRDEQYKNKAIIYYTLMKYSDLLQGADQQSSPRVRQLQRDFRRLFTLYSQILLSESFSRDLPEPKNVEYVPFSSNVICSYCRCNIFNRFLTCPSCVGKMSDGDDDNYDICLECYSIGRSCACISKLKWAEQFRWKDLLKQHEVWRNQILQFRLRIPAHEFADAFMAERIRLQKKTLAEICQEELRRRPWVDITKLDARKENNEEIVEVNEDGQVRKRRKIRRSEKFRKQHGSCHICKTPEPKWKLATCAGCGLNYCYGSLYRAFDISPLQILEEPSWNCPKCRKICSCAACRRDPAMEPYEPTGTLLGHDTRKVADPRSVESLVDFSHSNINWLIKSGDHGENVTQSRRIQKHMEEAEKAKLDDPVLDLDHDEVDIPVPSAGGDDSTDPTLLAADGRSDWVAVNDNGLGIDPALTADGSARFVVPSNAVFREDMANRYEDTEAITFEYSDLEVAPTALTSTANSRTPGHGNREATAQTNGKSFHGLDGTADVPSADVLPIDPSLGYTVSSRRRSKEDEEFMPEPHSLQNIRTGGFSTVTRRNKARVRYTEDPIILSDQDEPEERPIQTEPTRKRTRKNTLKSPVHQQDEGSSRESPESEEIPIPDAADSLNHNASSYYAQQALELGESPSVDSTSPSDRADSAPVTERREPMSQAEKNRKAKLMAIHWAEGNADDIDSDDLI